LFQQWEGKPDLISFKHKWLMILLGHNKECEEVQAIATTIRRIASKSFYQHYSQVYKIYIVCKMDEISEANRESQTFTF